MPTNNTPFGAIPATGVSNQDLVDAGIPGLVLHEDGRELIKLDSSATNDHLAAAMELAGLAGNTVPFVTSERVGLTNHWLSLKACLGAVPAPPETGDDPHVEVRNRLEAEVQLALDAVTNAGGVG